MWLWWSGLGLAFSYLSSLPWHSTNSQLQTHRFSSRAACEDGGDRSLPSGHPLGEWSARDLLFRSPQSRKVLGSLPHPKPQDPQPVDRPLGKGGREPRLTIFQSLEEMAQVGSDTPISIPRGKPPLQWKWPLLTWIFPWLRKRRESCYLLRSKVWGVARVT